MHGKFENGQFTICPRNGYVGGKAISNLPEYFNIHPEEAKKEGYLPVVELEESVENSIFVEENGIIYEKKGEQK